MSQLQLHLQPCAMQATQYVSVALCHLCNQEKEKKAKAKPAKAEAKPKAAPKRSRKAKEPEEEEPEAEDDDEQEEEEEEEEPKPKVLIDLPRMAPAHRAGHMCAYPAPAAPCSLIDMPCVGLYTVQTTVPFEHVTVRFQPAAKRGKAAPKAAAPAKGRGKAKAAAEPEPKAKRGRGRPKKIPEPEPEEDDQDEPEEVGPDLACGKAPVAHVLGTASAAG